MLKPHTRVAACSKNTKRSLPESVMPGISTGWRNDRLGLQVVQGLSAKKTPATRLNAVPFRRVCFDGPSNQKSVSTKSPRPCPSIQRLGFKAFESCYPACSFRVAEVGHSAVLGKYLNQHRFSLPYADSTTKAPTFNLSHSCKKRKVWVPFLGAQALINRD